MLPMKNPSLCALFIAGLLLAPITHAGVAGLPPGVRLALDSARIPAEAVSLWTRPVDHATPALAINATAPMNPASVMKLVTAFSALERLGPAHTWTTRIARDGPIHAAKLRASEPKREATIGRG